MTAEDRDIVVRLARDVMGWVIKEGTTMCWGKDSTNPSAIFLLLWEDPPFSGLPKWNPLDSWADASMVVEKLQERGFWIRLDSPYLEGTTEWWATCTPINSSYKGGEGNHALTGPRAVCLAALKVLSRPAEATV